MTTEIFDRLDHANYYKIQFRVESNCAQFQLTGRSPQKLKHVTVEWSETFFLENGEYDHGVMAKSYKNPVHARSLAIQLMMGHITSAEISDVECYEGPEAGDYDDELVEVKFGYWYPQSRPSYRLILTYEFDFYNGE